MKYFRIRHTLNKNKVYGHSPQVKEVKHNCHVWDEPKFIQHHQFEKIDFHPIISNPILYAKSKKTDLIEHLGIGFSHRLVMSDKLKNILNVYNNDCFQFFQCSIFHKNIEDKSYWIMNPYKFNQEFIDFEKSETLIRVRKPEGGTKLENIKISSLEDFNTSREFHKKNNSILSISKIVLKDNILEDFFMLRGIEGGFGCFVSEKLKNEIEYTRCTGIEFQPLNLTFSEWVSEGGEREKIYGN